MFLINITLKCSGKRLIPAIINPISLFFCEELNFCSFKLYFAGYNT